MNPSSLVETVQSMYAAFGRGDVPAILARVSPNIDWRLNVAPDAPGVGRVAAFKVLRGPAGVGEFFAGLARDLEFHAFQPTAFFSAGTSVAVHVQMEWTVRTTKHRLRTESMHVFSFDADGRLSQFREFTDTLGIAAAWDEVRATS